MIDMKLWNKLVKEWEKIGPVYQIPRRTERKLNFFLLHGLPRLVGKKTLEIGANAAYFGLYIQKKAESYIALEPGNLIAHGKSRTDYHQQALITRSYMENENVEIVNATVRGFCKMKERDFNALFMCFCLYHLSDKEIDLLKEHILPKCNTVIIQTRAQSRPSRHNSYKFWKSKRVVKFLEKEGFSVEVKWEMERRFSMEIATRA